MEVLGTPGSAPATVVRGRFGDDRFAVFGVHGGRVVGAVAVNDPAAARAGRRMIDRAITVDPDRLADPTTDLRKLLRG